MLSRLQTEEDKTKIHLRVWTNNPRDGLSACGLTWTKGKTLLKYSLDPTKTTCNKCKKDEL